MPFHPAHNGRNPIPLTKRAPSLWFVGARTLMRCHKIRSISSSMSKADHPRDGHGAACSATQARCSSCRMQRSRRSTPASKMPRNTATCRLTVYAVDGGAHEAFDRPGNAHRRARRMIENVRHGTPIRIAWVGEVRSPSRLTMRSSLRDLSPYVESHSGRLEPSTGEALSQ